MKRRSISISALALSLLLLGSCAKAPVESADLQQSKMLVSKQVSLTSATPSPRSEEIHAAPGVVLEQPKSQSTPKSAPAPSAEPAAPSGKALLSEDEAKSKALAHAGVKAADAKFVECRLDRDDGRTVYEIEFYSGNKEYDYEVDGYTGKILSFDYDAEKYAPPQSSGSSISADEAKQLALAKMPGAQLKDIREFETDRDDGRLEYEGTIVYQEKEYEFEIDGSSGAIRSWDVESIYD